VYTAHQGRFEIAVTAATAVLRVTKPGWALTQVPLAAVDAAAPLQIRMPRGAAINGRLVDEAGGPAVDIPVRVRRVPDPGERGAPAFAGSVLTDDFGEFRAGSLPAGNYELSVDNRQVLAKELATNAADAQRESQPEKASIRVRAGEESQATLFYNGSSVDARNAAEYVAGFEAGQGPNVVRLSGGRVTIVRGNASVTGRVTGPTGRAVAGAIVRLEPASAGSVRLAATSTSGVFQIANVAPGAYRVIAAKSGFVAGEHGQTGAGRPGRVITLRDRQRLERADVTLPRGAVVTGIVADADGEPLEGLAMHVWRLRYWNGRQITEAAGDVSVRRTDDRGQYRLHGLQPGTYYVVASDDPSGTSREVTAAPRSYYPAAPVIGEASTIRVDVGIDAEGTHLTFNPAKTFRLAGTATDSEGYPLEGPVILAGSTRGGVAVAAQRARMSGADFSFDNVPPGSYVIHATQRRKKDTGQVQEFATQFVDIAENDVTRVRIVTTKGTTINGRIQVEGDRSSFGTLPFEIVSADPDFAPPPAEFRPWTLRINPDGSFQADGLSGPVRFTSTATPIGWFLKSVDIAGRNAADEPVTFGGIDGWRGQVPVVFSSAGADIAGRVVDGRNEAVGTYVAVAFPIDLERRHIGSRYIKTAYPDDEGRFVIGTLPPGDYFVAAVDTLSGESIEDPTLLDALSRVGRRVTLAAGQRMMTDLTLSRFRR
jgi:protocatechuate 3,4-dioxygenase beta subunit